MAQPNARLGALLRLVLVAVFAATGLTVAGPVANPSPVAAITTGAAESTILGLINAERTKRGLAPLRLHSGLVDLAGERAASMARTGVFKHPDCLRCLFDRNGIQYWSGSEIIAWTGYGLSTSAAKSLFSAWRNSPLHWGILMSGKFNYIGLGVAATSANKKTYAAGLLTESLDRTKPWAEMRGGSRKGTTVTWTWAGADRKLQTHTAGLKNFVVQYRVDGKSWKTIRAGTTARSLSLKDRARGHCYSLRVKARDNRGLLSSYTSGKKVCIP